MTRLLYSITDALQVLPVSRSTLYVLMAEGALRTVKIGRRTFIAHDELDRYVRELGSRAASAGQVRVGADDAA